MNIEKVLEELKTLVTLPGYVTYVVKPQNKKVYIDQTFTNTYYVHYCDIGMGEYYKTIEEVAEALCDYDNTVDMIVEREDRYRAVEIPKLREYYKKHIEGKTKDEVRPSAFDFYSDWYKEVYGYRPRLNYDEGGGYHAEIL